MDLGFWCNLFPPLYIDIHELCVFCEIGNYELLLEVLVFACYLKIANIFIW